MRYISHYESPLGSILLAADEEGLTGLWFEGQKYLLLAAKRWLDTYFSGDRPDHMVPLHFVGTDFQKEVWEALCEIPYGQTRTYGDMARLLAAKTGRERVSARAVGGAVGHNRISILVPCHRVIGSDRSLTGYAGGLERKVWLLELEGGSSR